MTRRRAAVELIGAGALWGFGFIATIWALRGFTPAELLSWRFFLAVLAGEIWWWLMLRNRSSERRWWAGSDLKRALPAGLLLASMMLPQTIGLQSTSAAKSGFITTLYVLFVPILSQIFLGHRLRPRVYFFVALALIGTGLLMGIQNAEPLNPGDLWTLLCVIGAAFHILYVGAIADRIQDAFRFNTAQSLFCLLFTVPVLLFQSEVNFFTNDPIPWAGVLMLALGSSVIAFTIQIRAQRVIAPTTASMLFLLESPFALIFGLAILGEALSWTQSAGAALILLSAALTLKYDSGAGSKQTP